MAAHWYTKAQGVVHGKGVLLVHHNHILDEVVLQQAQELGG